MDKINLKIFRKLLKDLEALRQNKPEMALDFLRTIPINERKWEDIKKDINEFFDLGEDNSNYVATFTKEWIDYLDKHKIIVYKDYIYYVTEKGYFCKNKICDECKERFKCFTDVDKSHKTKINGGTKCTA